MPASVQPQVGDTPIPYGGSDLGFGSVSVAAPEPVNVQQSVAPAVNQYGQPPLPPRSQPQTGQAPPVAQVPASAAPLPLSQPPMEPLSTSSSTTAMEQQPPRPPSTDKTSPEPSDDHDDPVDAGSGTGTWASRVKSKPPHGHARSPNQASNQPPHVTPAPGPSAPAMLSPTGGAIVSGNILYLRLGL